jgi:hypothetical protein
MKCIKWILLTDNSYLSRLLITPTYLQSEPTSNLDDYGKKRSITVKLTGGNGEQVESSSGSVLFALFVHLILARHQELPLGFVQCLVS